MKKRRTAILLAAALILAAAAFPAAQIFGGGAHASDSSAPPVKAFCKNGLPGATIVFSKEDFMTAPSGKLTGILVTSVPPAAYGALSTGDSLRPAAVYEGSVVAVDRLDTLRFTPAADVEFSSQMTFVPLFNGSADGVGGENVTVGINLLSERNRAPGALALSVSTGKNLPVSIFLNGYDPDGDEMTFKLFEKPDKGRAEVKDDGEVVFTPGEGKTGKTTFSYYIVDSFNNVSDTVTVSVTIEKLKNPVLYDDLAGSTAQYPAAKLAEAGVYVGETVGGARLFHPDRSVTRGEFLTMAMLAAGVEPSGAVQTMALEAASWQRGYVSAALESKVLAAGGDLRTSDAVTRAEAAAIIERLLGWAVNADGSGLAPAWAAQSAANLEALGILTDTDALGSELTREEAVLLLYRMSCINDGVRLGIVSPLTQK